MRAKSFALRKMSFQCRVTTGAMSRSTACSSALVLAPASCENTMSTRRSGLPASSSAAMVLSKPGASELPAIWAISLACCASASL